MSRLYYIFGLVLIAVALGVPCAKAQQQTQDQPIPAYKSPLASQADNGTDADTPQTLAPDTRALTGAQDLSLGVPVNAHSYWQPHLDLSTSIDSNPPDGAANAGWSTWTSVSGGVDLHRVSGNSAITLNYVGGGVFSNDGTAGSSGIVQDLNFVDTFTFRRWAFTIIDSAAYTPELASGSSGFAGIPLPGNGGLGPGSSLDPGQGIITAEGQRLTNSTLGEADVYLTPRSSLTFVGGYSLLHFFDQDLLDYGDMIAEAGYNYQATRRDTIGASYLFSGFRYSNFGQSINSNTFQLSYGRRITGRLAFRIAAGPEFATFNTPIIPGTGVGTIGPPQGGSTNNLYWSLNTSLLYQMGRTGLAASYSHGVSGGSGVLAGSLGDFVTGSVSRQLTRTLSGNWNFGYSRNSGLAASLVPGTTPSSQTYDYWFTGAHLSRPWGRSLSMYLDYQLQYQNSNSSFCVGAACGLSYVRNLITIGVSWRKQPIPF